MMKRVGLISFVVLATLMSSGAQAAVVEHELISKFQETAENVQKEYSVQSQKAYTKSQEQVLAKTDPKKKPKTSNSNQSSLTAIPVYAPEKMRKVLEQDHVDISQIRPTLKDFFYLSNSLEGDSSSRAVTRTSGNDMAVSSKDYQIMYQTMENELGRSLSRYVMDLSDKAAEDSQKMEKDGESSPSTGAYDKHYAVTSNRTDVLINELLAMASSEMALVANDGLSGAEKEEKKSGLAGMVDGLTSGAKALLQ